jgi:hypothetical protein
MTAACHAANASPKKGVLAAAQSNAALGEKLLSLASKFVICNRPVRSRDKSFNNKLIKKALFTFTKIHVPPLQDVTKD